MPQDHDVLIEAEGIAVNQVRFLEPHTLIFEGTSEAGHQTVLVMHFSQVKVRVIYVPKSGPERTVTGFSNAQGVARSILGKSAAPALPAPVKDGGLCAFCHV